MGQSPSRTTIFRHYRPTGSEQSDIKNGTVPSDSSLTTKIFPLLRLSRIAVAAKPRGNSESKVSNVYPLHNPLGAISTPGGFSFGNSALEPLEMFAIMQNQDLSQEQEQSEQEQEQVDPIALLAERLGAIESALGIGTSQPSESNLLGRLNSIETSLTKDLRERNLPPSITKAQAADPSFLRKTGIDLRDFTSGKVRIEG